MKLTYPNIITDLFLRNWPIPVPVLIYFCGTDLPQSHYWSTSAMHSFTGYFVSVKSLSSGTTSKEHTPWVNNFRIKIVMAGETQHSSHSQRSNSWRLTRYSRDRHMSCQKILAKAFAQVRFLVWTVCFPWRFCFNLVFTSCDDDNVGESCCQCFLTRKGRTLRKRLHVDDKPSPISVWVYSLVALPKFVFYDSLAMLIFACSCVQNSSSLR